jgi:hypothetical protein
MKKSLFFLAAFFALGCVMPNVVATAQTSGTPPAANECVPRTADSKPCTPAPKPAAGKHNKKHAAPAANQQQTAPPPAAPSPVDKLAELLVASQVQLNVATAANMAATTANQQRETDAFVLAQQALKLQADTDAARIDIEKEDADTRKATEKAYEKYLPQFARATLLDAKAHMTDAILGNLIRAGGELGSAVLLRPAQVVANGGSGGSGGIGGAGGKGGDGGSSSQSQVQQQTASPSQSQSQVAP